MRRRDPGGRILVSFFGPARAKYGCRLTSVVLAVQKAAPVQEGVPRQRVVDLDELFKSTRTKPKLYYMPVSEEVARERLAAQRRDSRGRH